MSIFGSDTRSAVLDLRNRRLLDESANQSLSEIQSSRGYGLEGEGKIFSRIERHINRVAPLPRPEIDDIVELALTFMRRGLDNDEVEDRLEDFYFGGEPDEEDERNLELAIRRARRVVREERERTRQQILERQARERQAQSRQEPINTEQRGRAISIHDSEDDEEELARAGVGRGMCGGMKTKAQEARERRAKALERQERVRQLGRKHGFKTGIARKTDEQAERDMKERLKSVKAPNAARPLERNEDEVAMVPLPKTNYQKQQQQKELRRMKREAKKRADERREADERARPQGKGKRQQTDKMKRRLALIKKLMKEEGMGMIQASKYIKANNLEY